jgi:uncharacterized protein (PEP-CTERM system associated)
VGVAFSPAQAAWDFSPRLLVAEAYTDNRALASPAQAETDLITQVVPGFSLVRDNKSFLVNLDYQIEGVFYASSAKDNDVFQQLNLNASKQLKGDWASFVVAATKTQANIDPRRTSAGSNLFLSTNRTNSTTLSLGPIFRWRPTNYILSEANFQYGIVHYDEIDNADSEQWRGRLLIDATEYPGKIGWKFQYSELRTENDFSNTATFRRTSADIYFHMSGRTALIAGAGWDDNQFQSVSGADQKGGSWRVGFDWSPRRRTSFSAFYNDRYFGESAEVRFHNESRHTSVDISFQEDLESAAQGRIGDLTESAQLQLETTGSISTEVAKSQQATLSISRNHSKTETHLTLEQYRREFQQSLVREEIASVRLGWRWFLSSLITIDVSGRSQRFFFSDIDRTDHLKIVSAAWSYQLGRRLNFGANLERNSRTTSDGGGEYVSNTLMCSLTAQF